MDRTENNEFWNQIAECSGWPAPLGYHRPSWVNHAGHVVLLSRLADQALRRVLEVGLDRSGLTPTAFWSVSNDALRLMLQRAQWRSMLHRDLNPHAIIAAKVLVQARSTRDAAPPTPVRGPLTTGLIDALHAEAAAYARGLHEQILRGVERNVIRDALADRDTRAVRWTFDTQWVDATEPTT